MPTAPILQQYPLGDAEFAANPYPLWAELRSQAPVHHWEGADSYVVVSFDAARDVLGDTDRFSPSRHYRAGAGSPAEPGTHRGRIERNGLFHLLPEDHLRVRRLVNPSFSPASVRAVQPAIAAAVRRHLEPLVQDGGGDLADIATALPTEIMGRYLGLDDDVTAWLAAHTASIATFANPFADEATRQRLEADLGELSDALNVEFAARRSRPSDDLLSSLVSAVDEGDRLSDDELFALVVALLVAGADTTTNLLTLGSLALIQHPDTYEALRADRSLLAGAVAEMLRWSYIGFVIARFAIHDTTVAGFDIAAGSQLLVAVGAALRDPTAVTDPDQFDIGRSQPPPLAFGVGPRHCLGAALARTTAAEFFDASLDAGILSLAGEPQWRPHFVMRGFDALPVAISSS